MIARTGSVVTWHWAHRRVHNPDCTIAPESEWHLAWKALGIDGSQEVVVGRRRADVLAPGGFAVEFQASALDGEEVRAREEDWAAQGGMVWVFRADKEFAAGRIRVWDSIPRHQGELVKPGNRLTVNITWSHAPERVRAARAPSFADIGNGELLFIGGWYEDRSPFGWYIWRVSRDWVVQNLLHGDMLPAPLAGDPREIMRAEAARRIAEQEGKRAALFATGKKHREEQKRLRRIRLEQERQRSMEIAQRQEGLWPRAPQPRAEDEPGKRVRPAKDACDVCGQLVSASFAEALAKKGLSPRHVLCGPWPRT